MTSVSDKRLYSPGLKIRRTKSGDPVYYWVAAQCSRRAREYPVRTVLLGNQKAEGAVERARQCQMHHGELLQWLGEGGQRSLRFTGTVASLFDLYELHPESPIHKLKYNSRRSYLQSIGVLKRAVGARLLSRLTGLDFKRWYDELARPADPNRPPMTNRAHSAITMLRQALDWGIVLELPHCQRLDAVLGKIRFPAPGPRTGVITFSQVKAIIETAHKVGRPSIALAQALQFELTLRQKDVIGEWYPEAIVGGISGKSARWANGLTWSHISSDLILRKTTTKTGSEVAFDLNLYPLLIQELERISAERRVGPLIVNETTGLPYTSRRFARIWRRIATKAGVPASIQNMDSRAGGITEATDAEAPLELVRHHATHKDVRMTARYSRQTLKKTSEVARIRTASRRGEQDKNGASERRQNGVRTAEGKSKEEQRHDTLGPTKNSSAGPAAARPPDRAAERSRPRERHSSG